MPAKDEEKFISYSLNSLLNQTFSPTKLVIILDECTDETPNIVKKYSNRHKFIKILENSSSKYRGLLFKAHKIAELDNKGIKALNFKPDYIMVANADSIYSKNYIEEAISIMEKNKNCAIVGWPLDDIISGSGIIYRSEFLDLIGGYIKECANEELYMQMKAISMGFQIHFLKTAQVYLLRPPGHSNLRSLINDALRDGFAMYTLGFSFFYTILRATFSLFKKRIQNFFIMPLGYIAASILRIKKEDISYTNIPSLIQYIKIQKYKKQMFSIPNNLIKKYFY